MKLFRCDHCGHLLYFENTRCERYDRALGYAPLANNLLSLDGGPGIWMSPALYNRAFVHCANAAHGACNWLLLHAPGADPYCRACRHNAVVPNIDNPIDLGRWQAIERAKKRLIYSLLRLHLPLATRNEDPAHDLSFRFLNEDVAPGPVFTGHDGGIITLALNEADDAAREYRRTQFNEPYRTLLGHFRHEIGHYYWAVLVDGRPALAPFRVLFRGRDRRLRDGARHALRQRRPARLAADPHFGLCHGAPMGGFRRDLRALPASGRHHRDGRRLRHQSPPRRQRR